MIFSSRGGALFGYRLLWLFWVILLFKWALVFASARHIVLTGFHPFQRWSALPGPAGWLPLVFFVLALFCFPIWVAFHAGTIGTLIAGLTGTADLWNGSAYHFWGMLTLGGALVLVCLGGYRTLEKTQLLITILMLLSVTISLFFLPIDWAALGKGLLVPQPLHYPPWVVQYPELAQRPVWVEIATYVGVIGGSSYDYLAYVSYLREKNWGRARDPKTGPAVGPLQDWAVSWVRAPLIDCALSFLAVYLFTTVFVASGAAVLGPAAKVPAGTDLLSLQAAFVTPIHPWLRYLYFAGAFLTIFGTLYGTIEVAPTVLREMALVFPEYRAITAARLRQAAVLWAGVGGLVLLLARWGVSLGQSGREPPGLIALLTPANLFTGVLGCGLVSLLNLWVDYRFLPRGLRMGRLLFCLSFLGGLVFFLLGLKGYWDHNQWRGLGLLCGTIAAGLAVAAWREARARSST